MNELPKLYTHHEVATYLGLHPDTVKRWANAGKIKGSKLGDLWRFTETDIKNFVLVSSRRGL